MVCNHTLDQAYSQPLFLLSLLHTSPMRDHADPDNLRARLTEALRPPLAAALQHVPHHLPVIPIPDCGEIHLVTLGPLCTVVVHCQNDKISPFTEHSTIFNLYVGSANPVHRMYKDAKQDDLPDAIQSLSLDGKHKSHWMDIQFLQH